MKGWVGGLQDQKKVICESRPGYKPICGQVVDVSGWCMNIQCIINVRLSIGFQFLCQLVRFL